MPASRLDDWHRFYQLEPFGPMQESYQWAFLITLLANALRGADDPPYKIEDFAPHVGRELDRRQDDDEQFAERGEQGGLPPAEALMKSNFEAALRAVEARRAAQPGEDRGTRGGD